MYLKGYDYVKEMLSGIAGYLEKKEISSISNIVGVAQKSFLRMNEYNRKNRYFVRADLTKCAKCKKCRDVCIYEAIDYTENGPVIDENRCDGCGLCASMCSNIRRAIEMIQK